jgi:hypothetical protein
VMLYLCITDTPASPKPGPHLDQHSGRATTDMNWRHIDLSSLLITENFVSVNDESEGLIGVISLEPSF